MLLNRARGRRPLFPYALIVWAYSLSAVPACAQLIGEGLRVTYAFADSPGGSCRIEMTGDSLRVKRDNLFAADSAVRANPDSAEDLVRRALSAGEKDTAGQFLELAGRWKGYKRYACKAEDGYGFTLWTDSLVLNCDNCFSCNSGMSMSEAKMLEKIGRMTLWLYRLRGP